MLKSNHKLKCKQDKTQVANDVPEKDVELCLEVEMDDEVKDIITSPEKYASTLLDVTVIKPKDIDKLYTSHKKTMSSDEVRKLIASMTLDNKEKRNPSASKERLERDHKDTNMKSSGDHAKHNSPLDKHRHTTNKYGDTFLDNAKKMYTTDDTSSELFLNRHANQKVKQIYTTPKTFLELNSMFECKKKKKREHNEKLNTPCLCQNCAIVGVVTDSQKKPFATEMMYDPRELSSNPRKETKEETRRRKLVNFKEGNDHSQCQQFHKHLSEKIKHLEARIAMQEEKSVPKDYFRRIVTKLVAHITKLTNYSSQIKLVSENPPKKHKHSPDKCDNLGQRFVVNPILVDTSKGMAAERESFRPHREVPSTSTTGNQLFWKWGEEILKPGIDLKNKIIVLMEDTLHNLKKSKERTKEEEIKHFVDEFSNNLYKTVHEVPERDGRGGHNKREVRMKTSNVVQGEGHNRGRRRNSTKMLSKRECCHEEPVSVEYINSKILKWQDTQTTFKFESSDIESMRAADFKHANDLYRAEFMKTLLNTKEDDKLKLWHSIWNQASANGQTREDKVTIQLPDRKDPKNKNIEILYSLGDLENLLVGKRSRMK